MLDARCRMLDVGSRMRDEIGGVRKRDGYGKEGTKPE
jgi:hypothetical protein